MTIDHMWILDQHMTASRSDGQWHYTVTAVMELATRLQGGRLEPIVGADLALLTTQFGWDPEVRFDLHYDETAEGGSPSLAQVARDIDARLGEAYVGLHQSWVGKAATATLEAQS